MKQIVTAAWISLTLLTCTSFAQPIKALYFTSDFLERSADGSWEIVDSRSYAAPTENPYHFSMGNFTCRFTADIINDSTVRFQSALNGYGDVPRNYFDEKTVLQGASMFFDSVLVRGESIYRIRMTFDSLAVTTTECSLRFGSEDFADDPSGDFDFYFIEQSLGDYHWNAIRDAFEYDYERLINTYQITERDKIYFYICPCELADVGWDPRWDNGYDYARKNVFAKYTHGLNRLHPQVVYMVKFMRIWGYAPAILLEGLASTLEYGDYFAREALEQESLPDLTRLGKSAEFRALDREMSSHVAGSFVRYLIKIHGDARFKQWYTSATDLTLPKSFEETYNRPMTEVQAEWRAYLDTVTIVPGLLEYFGVRSQQFSNLGKMLTFAEARLEATGDSSQVAPALAPLYFTFGEYVLAETFARKMVKSAKGSAGNDRIFLANMLLAQGEINQAEELYYEVAASDSTIYMAYSKLGQIEYDRGNTESALSLFQTGRSRSTLETFVIDADLWIGDAFATMGQPDSSKYYYQDALNRAKLLAASHGENALHHLAVGKAALRLNSLELAEKHLSSALFLEERMFYLGQIFLATGMMYDARGEHEKATAEYRQVLQFPTAYLDRRLAERYIQTPYQN